MPKLSIKIHFEDGEDTDLHMVLKLTVPKKWKAGPTTRLTKVCGLFA